MLKRERWEKKGARQGVERELFSNIFFHICVQKQREEQMKVPLELLRELAHLFSALTVEIEHFLASNLF